jgi:hypothetical protein
MSTEHVTKTVKIGAESWRPVCTCGWRGKVCRNEFSPEDLGERHVREVEHYAREAAKPKAPVDDSCRGGECGGGFMCSRHGAEYQARYGRAHNE